MKLTVELQNTIVALLKEGNYIQTACQKAGISRGTFYLWLEHGKDPEFDKAPLYCDFRNRVHQALAEAESAFLAQLKGCTEGKWERYAWVLERRWPDHWGKKERQTVEIGGTGGGPVRVEIGYSSEGKPFKEITTSP